MRRMLNVQGGMVLAALMLVSAGGCQSAQPQSQDAANPPVWLEGAMVKSDKLCAIGASEPSFYLDDAQSTAADHCRTQLARTVSTQITSVSIDTATEDRNSFEEATVSETIATITERVVENAEVVEYWLDAHGVVSNKRNITYALCCMPRGQ